MILISCIDDENNYEICVGFLYLCSVLLQSNVHCKVLCMTMERQCPRASVLTVSVGTARCSAEGSTRKKHVLALIVQSQINLQFQASVANSALALTIVLKVMIVMPMLLVLIYKQLILVAAMMASPELMVGHVQVNTPLFIFLSYVIHL